MHDACVAVCLCCVCVCGRELCVRVPPLTAFITFVRSGYLSFLNVVDKHIVYIASSV